MESIVRGGVYSAGIRAADPVVLAKRLAGRIGSEAFDSSAKLIQALDALRAPTALPTSDDEASDRLILEEAVRVAACLRRAAPEELSEPGLRESEVVERFEARGMDVPYRDVHYVEDFPGPYAGLSFSAMHFDAADGKALGIEPGVYLRRAALAPFVTTYLMAHEMAHSAFSLHESTDLVRGLEEGFADLIAASVCAEIYGVDTGWLLLRNMRFRHPMPLIWSTYRIAIRQCSLLITSTGGGLWDLARQVQKSGRQRFQEMEAALYDDPVSAIDGLASDAGSGIDRMLAYRAITFPDSYVVSPLAFCVFERDIAGRRVDDLARDLAIPTERLREVLQKVQHDLYLVFLDGDVVDTDQTKSYLRRGLLRYSLE